MKIGFIGSGKMATALAQGVLKSGLAQPGDIIVSDAIPAVAQKLAQDAGVTVLAGLPYLRVSPVHGTAFDIAGRGIASHENLVAAILFAAESATRARGKREPRA